MNHALVGLVPLLDACIHHIKGNLSLCALKVVAEALIEESYGEQFLGGSF